MKLNGKVVNLARLCEELTTAGVVHNALGTAGDEIFTYDSNGTPIELPPEAKAVIDTHQVVTLDDLKKAKYYEITAAYENELYGTFKSTATGTELEYDYSPGSKARWKELMDAVTAGFIPDSMFPFPITIANGVMVPHTKEQLLQLGAEITSRELWLYAKWQLMVTANGTIRQAVTPVEVAAITW